MNSPGRLVGLGHDLVDVPRFAAALTRRPALADRVFTDGELAYARRLRVPAPSLAARFAAKEATMKALGVGLGAFDFRDVEVLRKQSGEPVLALTGRALQLAASMAVGDWRISLSHTASTASAVVAALA